MRLITVPKSFLKRIVCRIIDVQIHKTHLSLVFSFQPMHDGRQPPAGRSPEGEKLHKLWLTCSQSYL